MRFTTDDYRSALEIGLERFDTIGSAETVLSLAEAESKGSLLFLRHDCERDLGNALRMAEIEHNLGIQTTYFIRVHSEYYNPLLPQERQIIRAIRDLGHEIGLHYEPRFYETQGLGLIEGIEQDRSILRMVVGQDSLLRTMSPHQPTLSPPDFQELARHDLVDVYTHPAFRSLRYYSDSGMKWREKTLHDAAETERCCQFLIHPDFWNDKEVGWVENLDRRVAACHENLTAVADREKEVFREYIANREAHDAKFRETMGGHR